MQVQTSHERGSALKWPGPSQPTLEVLSLVPKPSATVPPEDLPAVSPVALSLQPSVSSAPLQDNCRLMIHNHAVEYQQIYHEVVDGMLWCVSIK